MSHTLQGQTVLYNVWSLMALRNEIYQATQAGRVSFSIFMGFVGI